MPHDYFVPEATLVFADRGEHLQALWQDGARNTIYPVGPNRFLDRNFWAEVSFTRDSAGAIDGFTYMLSSQSFAAKRLNQ